MAGEVLDAVKQGATFARTITEEDGEIGDFQTAVLTAWTVPDGHKGAALPMDVEAINADTLAIGLSKEVTATMAAGKWLFELHFNWPDQSREITASGAFEVQRSIHTYQGGQ